MVSWSVAGKLRADPNDIEKTFGLFSSDSN